MARCIITGCEFIDVDRGRWCHGDLFIEGNCYIFNACLEEGEAAWQYDSSYGERQLTPYLGSDLFERRGVLVVSNMRAELNEAAQRYVG